MKFSCQNAVWLLAVICSSGLAGPVTQGSVPDDRQIYVVQIWQIPDEENRAGVLNFLNDHHLPALARQTVNRVGVFTVLDDETNHDVVVITPYQSLSQFEQVSRALSDDGDYQRAVRDMSQRELADPLFSRVDTRLLRAFAGMPQLELPVPADEHPDRVFELRLYESHTYDHAQRKVRMFNDGEIQLMKDVELGPVLFGESLSGPDLPNLIYLLSAPSAAAHQQHWQGFLNDPRWPEMRDLPEYKDTVSRIRNWMLEPTAFSGFRP